MPLPIRNVHPLVIRNAQLNLLLLMNKFKDYVYDYDYYPFVVNLIDVWEVVMVLMTYLIDHVLQIKLKI